MARVGGDVQLAGGRVSGRQAPSGRKWQGSQSSEGATELGFPGPTLGQMQGEAAGRAGEPSGDREEPPPEGLGGYDLRTQTEPRGPAGQVMRQHLHRQPGGVGREAPRGEMVEPDAVLEVSDGVLDLGVAAVVGLQFQGPPRSGAGHLPVGDAAVIAVAGYVEEGQLGTGRGLHLGRPLDGGPYPYVWLDGLTQKVREGGRIVNVCVVVATGVNAEGQREILGMDVGASEDGAFWLAFLRSLTARGLSGVELVTSDAHQGLKNAIAAVFAGASWQRCRTHFMANLLTRVPKRAQPGVATMVRTIYQQLSPAEVHGQLDRVVEQLREPFPQVAELLADAAPDILAFTAFPVAHWQKLWSNNPQERLNREIRRRTDVVGIFPNRLSARRLVGAVLAEQHDEWAEARRYLTIPNAAGNEALPEPNMLDAAA